MKNYLIKLLIDAILDIVSNALKELANKSDNTIDDQLATVFDKNKDQIKNTVKSNL